MTEMRGRFSGFDVSFRAPSKKKEMKMEFFLLHDIVAKVLCVKAGSFDMVTGEKFDLMVAISIGLKVVVGDYNDDRPEVNLGCDTRTNQDGPDEHVSNVAQGEHEKSTADGLAKTSSADHDVYWQGIFAPIQIRLINWATHFLPKIDPVAKGKGMLEVVARPTPVEENCQLVLNTAWDVSSLMADFDAWMHFRTVARLRDVSYFEDLTKIEDQFLLLAEIEQVAKLLQQRSMRMYKLYEIEVQKLVDEHLANFKLDVPSVNYDYLCILFLTKELKETARQQRDQRVLAGLPVGAPEASFEGDGAYIATPQITLSTRATSTQSAPPQTLSFEFSSQADQEQAQAREYDQRKEQINEVVRTVVNIEETANETGEHQASSNEHRAHDEQVGKMQSSLGGQQEQQSSSESPTHSEDPSVPNDDHVHNLGPNLISEVNNTDHQGPNPSTLQMVVYTGESEEDTRISFIEETYSSHAGSQQVFISSPPESPNIGSKLEEVEKVVASLDSRIMSMDSRMLSMDSKTSWSGNWKNRPAGRPVKKTILKQNDLTSDMELKIGSIRRMLSESVQNKDLSRIFQSRLDLIKLRIRSRKTSQRTETRSGMQLSQE
ncbi:hypothetical protein F511_16069 [Dorcoceras hygrometricum]|uniref:Uncharacterized protein n=1 Tax=Dorcoceras hygrometricum TaxID=472368 RepID=A0A2Z7A583_9LAMI|nr:hypothetical protein F511_16069 [Dorcoceras hygrometricum]